MEPGRASRERIPWALVALLAVALAVRYAEFTFRAAPLLDERVYVNAGRAILAGGSPFDGEYLYLPAFAWGAARFVSLFGESAFLVLLRVANIAAAAVFVWLGTAKSGLSFTHRSILSALFLLGAPSVYSSISTGNPTFLVGLAIFLALELAARRPLLAGSLLGASLLVKPLAPGPVAFLAGCRSSRAEAFPGGFWGLPAAALAVVGLLVGFLPLSLAAELLRQAPPIHAAEHNPAVFRLFELAGAPPPPWLFTAVVCLGALALALRRQREPEDLYLWALPAMFLALPLVWNHTLCLSWPIQAAALGLALRRQRQVEALAVLSGILLLAFWHGVHALPPDAAVARFLFTAAPALVPFALAAYCLLAKKPAA